jgi:hypothetical protein
VPVLKLHLATATGRISPVGHPGLHTAMGRFLVPRTLELLVTHELCKERLVLVQGYLDVTVLALEVFILFN